MLFEYSVNCPRHVRRVVLRRCGVLAADGWMRDSVAAAKAKLRDGWRHVSGDPPTLEHKLSALWPEGRDQPVHAAIEDRCLEVELGNPLGDECAAPVAVGAWKF